VSFTVTGSSPYFVSRAKRNPPFQEVMGFAALYPSYGTIRRNAAGPGDATNQPPLV